MAKRRLRKWVKWTIALIISGVITVLAMALYPHIPRKNLIDDSLDIDAKTLNTLFKEYEAVISYEE